ncbi:hypothetical protein SmJEL517_g03922 [Synchytrium microbalum]|uniref:GST N-terminal domain-containing protein n=1 Tax=Synchytrium microbalum TaxID=1806994 RepID=A0A507C526_9FUNG|nr:uncharacterized protein SmJEL517_g03922 [Synchytrium microbalum]TPX33086.1 hypothetical protein SmJEL517_g03922 [Synchytrium microbalum]
MELTDKGIEVWLWDVIYSSWSFRAEFLMRKLGIPATFHVMGGVMNDAEIAAAKEKSPSGLFPFAIFHLKDGDLPVWDSLAIYETLNELYPGKIWPTSFKDRANARAVCAEFHGGFGNVRSNLSCNIRARYPVQKWDEPTLTELNRLYHIFETARSSSSKHPNDQGWLYGTFSGADAFYFPVVTRLRTYRVEIDADKYPRAAEYVKFMYEDSLVKDFVERARKDGFRRLKYDAIYNGMNVPSEIEAADSVSQIGRKHGPEQNVGNERIVTNELVETDRQQQQQQPISYFSFTVAEGIMGTSIPFILVGISTIFLVNPMFGLVFAGTGVVLLVVGVGIFHFKLAFNAVLFVARRVYRMVTRTNTRVPVNRGSAHDFSSEVYEKALRKEGAEKAKEWAQSQQHVSFEDNIVRENIHEISRAEEESMNRARLHDTPEGSLVHRPYDTTSDHTSPNSIQNHLEPHTPIQPAGGNMGSRPGFNSARSVPGQIGY